jgi:2-polyprenyl-6-methoxyphenol hydroxylase-like FAD-dependent oxidoreductase
MAQDTKRKAIVIGGGLAGLTAAIALQHWDIDAVVYERATELPVPPVAVGAILQQNAMRVFRQLGLVDRIAALGTPLERLEHRTARGQLFTQWPLNHLSRQVGEVTIGLERAALHAALADALRPGSLHLGEPCVGFAQDAAGVTARFAGGREARADLLVGADGVNSVVRAQLEGPRRPRYAGYTIWEGVAASDQLPLPSGLHRMVWGRGQRFFSYPIGPDHLHWGAIVNAPRAGGDAAGGDREALLARFRGWMTPTEAIIAATDAAAIRRIDDFDRSPVKRWSEGRVTLVGEAAHPMTLNIPQGIAQAAEDAVVLAKCLTAEPDTAAALAAYPALRVSRTGRIATLARIYGAMGRWEDAPRSALRTSLLGMLYNTMAWYVHQKDVAYEV